MLHSPLEDHKVTEMLRNLRMICMNKLLIITKEMGVKVFVHECVRILTYTYYCQCMSAVVSDHCCKPKFKNSGSSQGCVLSHTFLLQ